ncbi:MAG TPA: hypothetical protein VKY40_04495, partial [Halanaerobiales bacterium]|nr:hypothetical protein [Halanaerobiales bacterium]
MKKGVKYFLLIVYSIFLLLFLFFFKKDQDPTPYVEIIFFILVLLSAENLSRMVYSSYDIYVSIILPILLIPMIILEPFWAGVIAMLGTINKLSFSNFWYQFIFNRTMFFIAASIGSF